MPDLKRKADGLYPVYGANGIKDRTDEYFHNKKSIIVGRKGSAGEINITEEKFWPLDVTYFVSFDNKKSDLRFIYYLLSKLELPKLATGVKPGINRNEVYAIQAEIPPLPEQQRIVAILDEAFAAIDQAKANAEKNLQNARELFESYLQSVFANPGEGWEEKILGKITVIQSGGTPLRSNKSYWDEGTIPWYSSGELNSLYTKDSERFITENGLKNSNAKLFPKGSLLAGMYDTAALKMSILDKDATFNQAIAGIKPNKDIDLVFIFHAINAIKPELLSLRRGVRQKNLSLEKIKDIKLFIPELSKQKKVVSDLNALSVETKKLEAIYRQKLAELDELKKVILQKAFRGELKTAQAAELV